MRHTLFIIVLSVIAATARAQVGEYRTDFAIGFNGGYTLSNIGFTPSVPQTMLGGLTGGLSMRYTCEKYFKSICAVVAEVNITQTGWKEKIEDMDGNAVYYADDASQSTPLHYERKMTYLQIPVMGRLGWGRERKGFQAFVQAGPQFGVFLSESTNSNIIIGKSTAAQRASNVVAQDTMAVERKFDYGIAAGAGIELSMRRGGHLILEGRYYYGLGNIYGNSKSDYFGKSNFGQIVIKLTYLFDLIRTKNDKIK